MTSDELRRRIDRGDTPPLTLETLAAADALARETRAESVRRGVGSLLATFPYPERAAPVAVALVTVGLFWWLAVPGSP